MRPVATISARPPVRRGGERCRRPARLDRSAQQRRRRRPFAEHFAQARRLADAIAQEVQLGAARLALARRHDVLDARVVQREHALDAFALHDAAHRDRAADAAALVRDHRADEQLHALLLAFLDEVVHFDGVTDLTLGEDLLAELFFDLLHPMHD